MTNLLKNSIFEEDWDGHKCYIFPLGGEPYSTDVGEIFVPKDWCFWFNHQVMMWDQPEAGDIWAQDFPERVLSGRKAFKCFTYGRKHDAGLYQQVQVEAGKKYWLRAYAHAWSNHQDGGDPHNGLWSEGAGYEHVRWKETDIPPLNGEFQNDAKGNARFLIGIDPTGGTNPNADTVVWGMGTWIYNGYARVSGVDIVAQSSTITVFLRSTMLWNFTHNDVYWDEISLEEVESDEPEPPPIDPPPDPEPTGTSKIGAHVQLVNDLTEFAQAGPAIIKFVGDWGAAAYMQSKILVIGRKHQDYDAQGQRAQGLPPQEAAQRFVNDQKETYLSNPHITYWEGHNEPVWSDEAGMAWYASFEIERMKLMDELGFKCVLGNFSTGTPPLELWPAFSPALEAAFYYEAILGLHEYSCPWMWWMTGPYQVKPEENEGDEGWSTLRYRKVYRQHLIPNGLGNLPLVITECGIDPLVSPLPQGVEGGTWKTLANFWETFDNEPDNAHYYFEQLVWYDQELQKDDYVIGATVFTWGAFGGWSSFDIANTSVADKLTQYVLANPAKEFVYPVDPEPPIDPDTCRGLPRVQYERTTVLLPPDATTDLARDIVDITLDREKWSISSSADDSGVGDLDIRRVIAISPENWPSGLTVEWYNEWYPGVEFWPLSYDNYFQLRGRLLAYSLKELGVVLTYPSTYMPPHVTSEFGVWRPEGYYHGGLDLRSSWASYGSYVLSATDGSVVEAGYDAKFGYQAVVSTSVNDGSHILVRYAHMLQGLEVAVGDYVNSGQTIGKAGSTGSTSQLDHLHISINWNGEYIDPALLIDWSDVNGSTDPPEPEPPNPDPPPEPDPQVLKVGFNDPGSKGAGQWMVDNQVKGILYVPLFLKTPVSNHDAIDLRPFAEAGIDCYVNLRYSWSTDHGGQGGLPPPIEWGWFAGACGELMFKEGFAAVKGWSIGNEPNNVRENPQGMIYTPSLVAGVYNLVRDNTLSNTKLCPGPIDPFFGPGSDCGEWFDGIWQIIDGAEWVDMHGYIRGPDPELVWSEDKFTGEPLTWQYLNFYGCVETLLGRLPLQYQNLDVIISEFNHLWVDVEPNWGWVKDDRASQVVQKAVKRLENTGVKGLCMYRWSEDDWHVNDNPFVLNAVKEANS